MYTHSMETIYLSLSAQVAVSTFFVKSPVGPPLRHFVEKDKICNWNGVT